MFEELPAGLVAEVRETVLPKPVVDIDWTGGREDVAELPELAPEDAAVDVRDCVLGPTENPPDVPKMALIFELSCAMTA